MPNANGTSQQPGQKPPPAYFLSLEIENIRCFGPRQTLDLSDGEGWPARWTILLGDNGAGKTTLLECLYNLQLQEIPGKSAEAHIDKHMDGRFLLGACRGTLEGQLKSRVAFGSRLQEAGSAEEAVLEHAFRREGRTGEPVDFSTQWSEKRDLLGLQCYGYDAGRRLGHGALEGENGNGGGYPFDDGARLINASEWLLQADYAANQEMEDGGRWARRRDKVLALLKEVLPDVEGIRFEVAERDAWHPQPRVLFKTFSGEVPLSSLSLGYRTLAAWMVDLASRLCSRYPDSENPLAEPAIVLVDEIDLHLHPTWQRRLLTELSARFPNTQFIATAHSPLVVQAAEDANVAVLRREGDHVVIDNDPGVIRGWRVDQVLVSDLFGLPSSRPPKYDEKIKRQRALLRKDALSEAEKEELRGLDEEVLSLPLSSSKEDEQALEIIRRAARAIEEKQG